MAFIKTEEVKAIRNQLKERFPQLRFSVRRQHYSSVNVTIQSGNINFKNLFNNDKDYIQLNPYHLYHYNEFEPLFDEMVKIIKTAPISVGGDAWFDKSDAMTDYFHTAYYFNLNIGQWDKPYQYKGAI
jgi:hypothetical protein